VKKEITPVETILKESDEINNKSKKIITVKEKYDKTENKNMKINEKDAAKNLSKRKVFPGKKIEKLTLDDFNRR
ncbi:MAG: hypothetical protein QOK71_05440, partial [Nitrososphaeraceae archaeon]|nr:hypothetical protein [Nitrososphaeraceae archaeon]